MSEGIAYGDYYLLGRLGAGGTSEVFLGKRLEDGVGGALLAVKRLLTQFAGTPELMKVFRDEAKLAKLLRHPNIAEVIDHGVNNKQHFLVMEFIHGKDLKSVLQRARKTGQRLPYVASAYIAAAIADALDYAHDTQAPEEFEHAIVHRDLSPQKILISYEGVPKLIDFSARDAKSRGIEGRLGSIKGRFGYLSPEQAISHPADRRSDVFALGVILYEMTTGMAPFRGGSDAATLGKVARASYSAPELVNASIPRGLAKIVEHSMQREADKRYATAGELAKALREWIREDGQVIDKGELARIMRELFFEDYEREKVRVDQYRKLTPMGHTPSGNKPMPMGDTGGTSGDESRTQDTRDERTISDEPVAASLDDDDDTGVSDAGQSPFEGTDTGISVKASDTGLHRREPTETGIHEPADDTGVHEPEANVGDSTNADEVRDERDDAVSTADLREGAEEERPASGFVAPTEQLSTLPFEATPNVATMALEPPKAAGDFNLTLDEVMPKLDDEPTGAEDTLSPSAMTDNATAAEANPWAAEQAPPTASFSPPAVLGEGPTVVASTFFQQQADGQSLFQVKTPSGKDPMSMFNEKTKVFEGVADLVRRTSPTGFGMEVTKNAQSPDPHAPAINEVLGAMSPLAVATTVEGLHVATTVQQTPLHVATVIHTPPEKAVTEVAKGKKKKQAPKPLAKMDESGLEPDVKPTDEDGEFLDDEVFNRAGPHPNDDEMNAPATTANAVPAKILHEQPDDLEEYEEVGRFFSRSDMITLVIAGVMGMLIMTASYIYALNVPLPDQDTIVEER